LPNSDEESQVPPAAAVARNMPRTVSVLIADDDAAVREALADLLADEASLTLVAVAANADEAVELAAREQPQVALLDVRMPGGGGPRAAREIGVRSPTTRFLALSAREDRESVYEMLQLGAAGYLVKGASDREIVEAIHRAARSQLSMSADLATACFKELLQDVSDRKRLEQQLEASLELVRKTERERQELLVLLVRAQEAERLRIASDIHDDSIQAMAAAALRLQQLRKRLSTETEVEALDKLEESFQRAITRLRHLMFNLRPVALERSGLAATLRAQLEQIQTEAGLRFELASHLTLEPPAETRVILYRIAMEALANVRKHASAHLIEVRLDNVEKGWRVQIHDDGSGFTPANNGSTPGHLGLTTMRERAQIAGGWWKLESQPGAGTSVMFWLPAVSEPIEPSTAVLPAPGGPERQKTSM
jgi:signal transduction histidine kinase